VLRLSPESRLFESVTVALVVPSYTLFTPVALTVNARTVMSAVAVVVVVAE